MDPVGLNRHRQRARGARHRRGPRTASGKKADPTLMADAAQNALEGLRERTEQGHLKAGRTPPSQVPVLEERWSHHAKSTTPFAVPTPW